VNLANYLRRQFAYNEWANREVLSAISSHGPDERSLQLVGHIISAEILWLERLQQQPQSMRVWPAIDLGECETKSPEIAAAWREYLAPLTDPDLSHAVQYTNSKGEPWTSNVLDILTHVVMHSAYHRGQIASHMRASGLTPAYTDFIHGIRQGLVK
jgi:uncharacterized damage-inducible protein DinB